MELNQSDLDCLRAVAEVEGDTTHNRSDVFDDGFDEQLVQALEEAETRVQVPFESVLSRNSMSNNDEDVMLLEAAADLSSLEVPGTTIEGADNSNTMGSAEVSNEGGSQQKQNCYCGGQGSGDIICCDNEFCTIGWYHLQCLRIRRVPQGTWYCFNCRKHPKVASKSKFQTHKT